ILLVAFILGALGCKPAEKAVRYTPENIVPTEKSLVWKISGRGLKKPSFLYGTIHMIPKNEFELPGSVRESLDNVRRVAFEIDMKEMTNLRSQMSLITKSFMAGGKTLKDLLNAEDYKLVKDKMAEKGLPGGMFERMKPMFLSTLFSSDEESPAAGAAITSVEMELYKMSKNRKLESSGLETAAYQMAVFDSIPYEVQAKMLVDGLRSMDTLSTEEGQLDMMLRLYREQDITAMQALIGEDSGMGQYEDILLKKRNQNWIPVMARMMADKPTLFAVGAGHLGGPNGVVTLLRKEGYQVEVPKD
ncbi:MAG: TraB/GumN family protein, partial [Saprospiraceae bacterium]|nr:TraB/GumN family protein [Saprospiraceae bacterium]